MATTDDSLLIQDEVIRRKLLADGDGWGDDRRIGLLLKTFIKWSNSNHSEEESHSNLERMLSILVQCEFSIIKAKHVYDMNLRELENYDRLYKSIEQSIMEAKDKILKCKNDLLQAKRIRKNRQEYDVMAKMIQMHPDRQQTLRKLKELDDELAELKNTKRSLGEKLELRKKQFHVLISCIHELQRILEVDEEKANMEGEMDTSHTINLN